MGLGHGDKLQNPPSSPYPAPCVRCGQNRKSPSREESNQLSILTGQKGVGETAGRECRRDSRVIKNRTFQRQIIL